MALSTKPIGSLDNPKARRPAAAPMFAACDPLGSVALRFHINSAPHDVSVEPWTTLLDVLRERIGLTGTKKGCNHGACGAESSASAGRASAGGAGCSFARAGIASSQAYLVWPPVYARPRVGRSSSAAAAAARRRDRPPIGMLMNQLLDWKRARKTIICSCRPRGPDRRAPSD